MQNGNDPILDEIDRITGHKAASATGVADQDPILAEIDRVSKPKQSKPAKQDNAIGTEQSVQVDRRMEPLDEEAQQTVREVEDIENEVAQDSDDKFYAAKQVKTPFDTVKSPSGPLSKQADKLGKLPLELMPPTSQPRMVRGQFGDSIPPLSMEPEIKAQREKIKQQDSEEHFAKDAAEAEDVKQKNTDPVTRFALQTIENVKRGFVQPKVKLGMPPMPGGMVNQAEGLASLYEGPGKEMRPALEEFSQDPIERAGLKSASELITPDNIALMAGMEALPAGLVTSAAGKIILGAGFSGPMAAELVRQYPEMRDAIVHEDWDTAAQIAVSAIPTIAFTAMGLKSVYEGFTQGVNITKNFMRAREAAEAVRSKKAAAESERVTKLPEKAWERKVAPADAPPEEKLATALENAAQEVRGKPKEETIEPEVETKATETETKPTTEETIRDRMSGIRKIQREQGVGYGRATDIYESQKSAPEPENLPVEAPLSQKAEESKRRSPLTRERHEDALQQSIAEAEDISRDESAPQEDRDAAATRATELKQQLLEIVPPKVNRRATVSEALVAGPKGQQEIARGELPLEPIVESPEKGVELGETIKPDELDSGAWSLYGEEHYTDLSPEQKKSVVASLSKRTTGQSIAAQTESGKPEVLNNTEQTPDIQIETDSLGVRWAVNPEGVRVSIPSGVKASLVQEYAKEKLAEQVEAQGKIKASLPTEAPKQPQSLESSNLPTEAPKPRGFAEGLKQAGYVERAGPDNTVTFEPPKANEGIAHYYNEQEGTESIVTRTPQGFSVSMRDTDSGNDLGTVRIFKDQTAALNHAQQLVNRFENIPAESDSTGGTLPEEEEADERPADQPDQRTEPEPLDRAGQESLENLPADDVQGPPEERPASPESSEGSGADTERSGESDSGRVRPASRVGDGEGEVSVPARREGRAAHTDYRITEQDAIGSGGLRTKYHQNIAALRTLQRIESEGRLATPQEQAELVKYVGWGGLKTVFKPDSPEYKSVKDLLSEEEYRAARASVLNAHYTSEPVIKAIWAAMERFGFSGGRVLEPSAGVGHFLGLQPADSAAGSVRTAIELDKLTGRILKQLYQKADVRIQGFEKLQQPSDFDIVVGNVPFGEYKLHDPEYNKHNLSIHNYFAVKVLDKMRPGGIAALITSKSTLDSVDPKARKLMAERGDLLGAIRLPNTAFKGNANTEVTTDILFFRKRAAGEEEGGEKFQGLQEITSPKGSKIKVNQYFAEHPEMMLGDMELEGTMYRSDEPTLVARPGEDLADLLQEAVERLPKDALKPRDVPESATHDATVDSIPDYGTTKPHGLAIRNGKVMRRVGDKLEHVADFPKSSLQRLKGMLGLRDTVREIFQAEGRDRPANELTRMRGQLNAAYDKFVSKNGYLHEPKNQRAMHADPDLPMVLSLEQYDKRTKTAKKADVFTKSTIAPRAAIERVESSKDAMLVSLSEKGKLDFAHMGKLTGKSPEELQTDLQEQGLVFQAPDGRWEPSDVYLSGNVRQKLAEAEKAGKGFEANVKALRTVMPDELQPSEIKIRLGAPWIPKDIIEQFIAHILGGQNWLRNVMVQHVESQGMWTVRVPNAFQSGNATTKWGTPRYDAVKLIEKGLNQQIPVVYDKAGDDKLVINTKETLAAQAKLEEINSELPRWVFQDSKHGDELSKMYNEKFNSEVPWNPDGAHLTFPGKSAGVNLRPHQKDTIWRSISGSGNVLADHVVGGGKTYVGVGTAMEWRRLGRARKPLLVVPNNLTEQWANDFRKMYPMANVLFATPEDFEGPKRKEFASRIATGDWDSVILGHRSYESLPVADEAYEDFMQEQFDELDAVMHDLRQAEGKRGPTVRQLEASKKRLEAKLAKRLDKERKDNTVNFEELGVDALIVDEAHKFKNLYFPTRMGRIPGVPQSDSNRAMDMYLKTRMISRMNNGKNILFMTGTPVSNTMAEMYVMQRYLDEPMMKSLGIQYFDAWAANFGRIQNELEIAPEDPSRFRMNNRFARFANVADLNRLYLRFADVKNAEDLKLPIPKLQGGKQETIVVRASPSIAAYVKELGKRADMVRKRQVDPHEDNMLNVTTDGRKAAVDMRLVDPAAEDDPDSKLNRVVQEVATRYFDSEATKGTQAIMLDMGVPSKKNKSSEGFNAYADIKRKLVNRGIPEKEIQFAQDFKTTAKKQSLYDDVNDGKVRIVLGSTELLGVGVNIQTRLKALHHVDVPWRPADIEQREGRILRQGNLNEFVEIPRYVTEGTFDAYNWQIIARKSKFIAQKGKDLKTREIEDVDSRSLSAEEAMALATGNPLVPLKIKTELELNKLRILQQSHHDSQFNNKVHLAKLPEEIEATKKAATDYDTDAKTRDANLTEKFQFSVDGKSFDERKDAGVALNEAIVKNINGDPRKVGTYAGFDVFVRGNLDGYLKGARSYFFDMNRENPLGTMQSLEASIRKIEGKRLERQERAKQLAEELTQRQGEVGKPFAHTEKIAELEKTLAEVNEKLAVDKAGSGEGGEGGEGEGGPPDNPLAMSFLGLQGIYNQLARALRGMNSGPAISQTQAAKGVIREGTGTQERKNSITTERMKSERKRTDRWTPNRSLEFIDKMESGTEQNTDEDEQLAQTLRNMLDEARQRVQDLGTGKLENYIENYFPHIWERPSQAASVIGRILGRRPMQGPASFLKQRTIPTTMEGVNLGLKPVTYNPVDLALLKIREMNRYVMAHEIVQDLKSRNLTRFVKFGKPAPDGWAPLNDKIFKVLQFSETEKAFINRGSYYAPKEVAQILNNFLSPGLRGDWRYDLVRGAGNLLNQAQLGLSAFHLMFTAMDSTISDLALAFEKLSRGEFKDSAKLAARAATLVGSPIGTYLHGNKVLKQYMSPGKYQEMSKEADAVARAGGRVLMDKFYKNDSVDKFWKAWKEGAWGKVGLQSLPAALEMASKPIMEHLVPRMKLGVFAHMAQDILERLPEDASDDEINEALDKAWDSVDNRMGQMVYDNLFAHKMVKDLGMISVRSLGWNIGTIREIGGGVKDFGTQAGNVLRGEKPELTHRMAYIMALAMITAWAGSVFMLLATGKAPQTLKDYYYPQSGTTDEDGSPERKQFASYVKDVVGFEHAPVKTAIDKFHPLIHMVAEMLTNKDFYGTKIRNEDDPVVDQAIDIVDYITKAFIPFAARNAAQSGKEQGEQEGLGRYLPTTPEKAEGFFGITKAPRYIVRTPAENKITEYMAARSQEGGRTKENAARYDEYRRLSGGLRSGRIQDVDVWESAAAGKITDRQAKELVGEKDDPPLARVAHLSLQEALNVYEVADDEERKQILPRLRSKLSGVGDLDPDTGRDVKARLSKIFGETGNDIFVPSKVDEELARLGYQGLRNVDSMFKNIKIGNETLALDPQQQAEYQEMRGRRVREELQLMFQDPEYKKLSNEDKLSEVQEHIRDITADTRDEMAERLSKKQPVNALPMTPTR